MEQAVVVVGAGPSGLAISACLTVHNIPHVILEKEDCYASLWKKRTYDRLNLHLAKEFCSLPHKSFPANSPTFLSKREFIAYLDNYVSSFNIKPNYHRTVEFATYDEVEKKWRIQAKNTQSGILEFYVADFLVVASGENSEANIPELPGLNSFGGEVVHSNQYKSGAAYGNKEVLVVGCGNSGMEIAYDLSNYGAHPSVVVRSPIHVLTKEQVHLGMRLLPYLPVFVVDFIVILMAKVVFGDLSKYGIHRPKKGPFHIKNITGRSPILDVGTVSKIKTKEIKVVPAISNINKKTILFEDGAQKEFDAIVFATGYKSIANNWLKEFQYLLNENGWPKNKIPTHWKGEKNLYCAGLSRRGLFGVSEDAKAITDDIKRTIISQKK
ncbi:hypothetical protein SLA2020_190040 [Shorea laevis]